MPGFGELKRPHEDCELTRPGLRPEHPRDQQPAWEQMPPQGLQQVLPSLKGVTGGHSLKTQTLPPPSGWTPERRGSILCKASSGCWKILRIRGRSEPSSQDARRIPGSSALPIFTQACPGDTERLCPHGPQDGLMKSFARYKAQRQARWRWLSLGAGRGRYLILLSESTLIETFRKRQKVG